MSTDLSTINAQIAELETLRKSLIAADRAESTKLAKKFVYDYDYTVKWVHPAQVRISRAVTSDCQTRIDAFDAQFPDNKLRPFVGGMTYSVLEGGYMLGGGGSVIVDFGDDKHQPSFNPMPIHPDDLTALRNGIVPLSIRKP